MGNDTNWLVERLYALSTAVAERDCSEFTMRVPAEPQRDADLVLSTAASVIKRLTAELAAMTAELDRLRALHWGTMSARDEITACEQNEKLRALLKEVIDLAEFWINREDMRGKSESEYRTWLALGHHSNALRNARNVLKGGA